MTEKQIKEMEKMVIEFYLMMGEEKHLFHNGYKSKSREKMRERIFYEELKEFFESFEIKDTKQKKISQLDAVVDMFYVATGNMIEKSFKTHLGGFKFLILRNQKSEFEFSEMLRKEAKFDEELILKAFKEVHRSNMTKITKDGKVLRREDGKVIKPDTFEEPNLEQFFKE